MATGATSMMLVTVESDSDAHVMRSRARMFTTFNANPISVARLLQIADSIHASAPGRRTLGLSTRARPRYEPIAREGRCAFDGEQLFAGRRVGGRCANHAVVQRQARLRVRRHYVQQLGESKIEHFDCCAGAPLRSLKNGLAGLRSRWMTPAVCARASARQACRM